MHFCRFLFEEPAEPSVTPASVVVIVARRAAQTLAVVTVVSPRAGEPTGRLAHCAGGESLRGLPFGHARDQRVCG